MIISEFELQTFLLPQRTKKFVRINKKFELTNFELSDGFCSVLVIYPHGTKNIVQISKSSKYRVFELTGVDCIVLPKFTTFGLFILVLGMSAIIDQTVC